MLHGFCGVCAKKNRIDNALLCFNGTSFTIIIIIINAISSLAIVYRAFQKLKGRDCSLGGAS